jgi:hypothetical protein
MAYRTLCVALLLSSLLIAGCGTVANLINKSPPEAGGKVPFGGVKQDLSCIHNAANGESPFGTHPKPDSEQHPQVGVMLLCAADLPLSLVGDVVTWPYTAAYSYINQPVPVPPVAQAPPIPTPPVTLAPAIPILPAERMRLIAQVLAAQGLVPLSVGASAFPQAVGAARIASLEPAAQTPPAQQAPAQDLPETLPEPRKLP